MLSWSDSSLARGADKYEVPSGQEPEMPGSEPQHSRWREQAGVLPPKATVSGNRAQKQQSQKDDINWFGMVWNIERLGAKVDGCL